MTNLIKKEYFMPATKQQIRQIIADNSLNSVADVCRLLRDSFKDILQELMETELDENGKADNGGNCRMFWSLFIRRCASCCTVSGQ